MPVRLVKWFAVLGTVAAAGFVANAQTPQIPPTVPAIPASASATTPSSPSGPDRIQSLTTLPAPVIQPDSLPGPAIQNPPTTVLPGPLPSAQPGTAPIPTVQAPIADAGSDSLPLPRFRIEPGRPLFEFRSGGHNSPHHGDADRWLDFGIIVQTEYLNNSPTTGPSTEFLFFRRLRPIIMGGMGNWQGILMTDFGAGESGSSYGTSIRWADFEYIGFYQAHLRFGSFKPWFSRELLTIGPHLQTVERSFVGDTSMGNPDYMIGVGWDQMLPNRKLAYYASVGLEDHVQGVTQMQMKSPAYVTSGANQGVIVTGRLDFYPIGQMPFDPRPLHTPTQIAYNRGDFHTDSWRTIVSTAMYGWWNDGNSNPFTVNGVSTSSTNADLDRAFGVEVSGGLRGHGVSADVEYQYIRADLIDSTFNGGLYVNGGSNLNKFSFAGGYMFPRDVELVGGWSIVDATGFERGLIETKVGVNWYVMKYAVRFSAAYSFVNNVNGTPGSNLGVTRVLAQFVW